MDLPSFFRAFDKEGKPIKTWEEYGEKFNDPKYQQVACDQVLNYYVSTVWLGMDHSLDRSARPVIFETMVFGEHGAEGGTDFGGLDQRRYCTEEEALAGHREVCYLIEVTAGLAAQEESGPGAPGRHPEIPQSPTAQPPVD